jgi:membrane protease YdiL (CAAX protease family)
VSSRPSSLFHHGRIARPGAALAAAAVGLAVAVFVAVGYPLWRRGLWALPEALIVAIDVAALLLPLATAVVVGALLAAGPGRRADSLGLARVRTSYIVLGVLSGLIMRAIVELFWPSAGRIGGSFGGDALLSTTVAVVGVVLIAPVVEELFFRGLMQRTLLQLVTGDAASRAPLAGAAVVFITTAAFVTLHLAPAGATASWGLAVGLALTGIVCGILSVVSRSTWPAIAAHITFNAGGIIVLLTG